jgi:translation elongation factor EF-1beta
MATLIIGMNVRPNMEEISDIEELKSETKGLVENFLGKKLTDKDIIMEVQPIAFGLKQIQATFMAPGNAETSKLEDLFANSKKVEGMTINRFELTRG